MDLYLDANKNIALTDCGDVFLKGGRPFITEWTVNGDATARTITLPLNINGDIFNCFVDWGDGTSGSTITGYTDANRIHTYTGNGIYQVSIYGECSGWAFNNAGDQYKITDIIYWGDGNAFAGFNYLTTGFYGCTNLKTTGKGRIKAKSTLPSLYQLFRDCTSLKTITCGLFDLCTDIKTNAFALVFQGCTSLTSIPNRLFYYNKVSASFLSAFRACNSLLTIPNGLFDENRLSTSFSGLFYGCSSLTSIPSGLFNNNILATTFANMFTSCSNLISIPSGLFNNNTLVTTFAGVFQNCYVLENIPSELFKYNILATDFTSTFQACLKSQQNPWTFYSNGESSTRFLNKSVNFTNCFTRTSFTGTQGTAPDLWNCAYGSGTPTKTNCWSGAGNSLTSLTNYCSIPVAWGGTCPITLKIRYICNDQVSSGNEYRMSNYIFSWVGGSLQESTNPYLWHNNCNIIEQTSISTFSFVNNSVRRTLCIYDWNMGVEIHSYTVQVYKNGVLQETITTGVGSNLLSCGYSRTDYAYPANFTCDINNIIEIIWTDILDT
jgi:hypothetical protein